MTEQFINSDSQPTGPDVVLDADHVYGDGILSIVGPCPPRILAAGPEFRVKCGHTLFKVTNLGVGNVLWAVDVVESTADDTYITGTPIYLEYTAGALKDAIFDKPFVFDTDQTAQYPNSVIQPAAVIASDTDPQDVSSIAPDPGISDEYSRADHVHFGTGGGGGGSLPAWLTFVAPPTTGWTSDNLAHGSTIVSTGVRQFLNLVPAGSVEIGLRYRTAPATPYTIIAAIVQSMGVNSGYTIGFRDSTGEMYGVFGYINPSLLKAVSHWNSSISVDTHLELTGWAGVLSNPIWLAITNDGTTLKFYVSNNRVNWKEIVVGGVPASNLAATPDVYFGGYYNEYAQVSLESWEELAGIVVP